MITSKRGDGMKTRRGVIAWALALVPAALGALKPKPKLKEGYEIIRSFDARDWARNFVDHVRVNPSIPLDEGTMTGWFANALMRGYDEHARGMTTTYEIEVEAIRGAVARGWCHDVNSHKVMDLDLAEAITQEILKVRTPV